MKNFITIEEFAEIIQPNKALLGIDWGLKKIGISASDSSKSFVFPLGVIHNSNADDVMSKILEIIRKKNIAGIVIGNPLKPDGTDGQHSEAIQKFASELLNKSGLPLVFQDERFTTKLAQRLVLDPKMKRKHNADDDSEAACHILQTVITLIQRCFS